MPAVRATMEFPPYNTRRYGNPWIAKVIDWPIGKPAVLEFGHTTHLTAEILAKVGDVVRWGQRDHRAKRHTEAAWGVVTADGIDERDAKFCREHWLATHAVIREPAE